MKKLPMISSVLLLGLFSFNSFAETNINPSTLTMTNTVMPDLFTGTMSYSIPIEVPTGRHGMEPNLALTYRSTNGSGWLGVGWELEVGAIERNTKFGVNYSADDYTFHVSGATIEIVNIGNDEYRAKIEGDFSRIRKLTASDGKSYWEATDKKGTSFFFGQTTASRQDDSTDASKIFKWCLDRVEDTNGNYMTLSYFKDQGQIYLDQIDYTGNGTLTPTNYVKFYRESRTDAPTMNTTNFDVKTAYRLKAIDVVANGGKDRVRAYKLVYDTDSNTTDDQYSISTGRSILSSVQQFGKDATLDASGTVTGGTSLPTIKLATPTDTNGFAEQTWTTTASNWGPANLTWIGDFDGDGKADIATAEYNTTTWGWPVWVKRSTGSSFVEERWLPSAVGQAFYLYRTWVGDVNGDGKDDIVLFCAVQGSTFVPRTSFIKVWRSLGTSFVEEEWWRLNFSYEASDYLWFGDFNGDGKSDIAKASGGTIWVWRSTGSVFVKETWTTTAPNWGTADYTRVGDYNGDGKSDIATASGGTIWVKESKKFPVDLVTSVSNGIGGTTTISYKPSSEYTNTLLPFPVQTVSSITVDDGNGVSSTTAYEYTGGFYYIPERDARGFSYVKALGPAGPNGEKTITETWFHQGNDTAVDQNNYDISVGYMKGKPYRVKITDGSGQTYIETTTSYASDETAPYFNPPIQVDTSICDGDTCGRQTKIVYTYDEYGNATREDQYGDLSNQTDDRTVIRSLGYNTTSWIVSLPTNETIYQGTYPGIDAANIDPLKKVSVMDFYYDGVADCTVASTNQTPTKGNLTRTVRWLSGGTSPEARTGYDSYGNPVCMRNARGYIATISYDSSFTFQTGGTNPLGQQTTTQYYGVNSVAADKGHYGQVKSVTDPNGAANTIEYDTFGRKTKVTAPDGFWTSWSYNNFGTVGSQHIQADSTVGLTTWTYFDGLGRTITAKKTGPEGKIITTQMKYNPTGTVSQSSLPYFDGSEASRWKSFSYDSVGRTIKEDYPDGTRVLSCYNDGVTTSIDPNNHRKRETRDVYGRLVYVDEYLSTYDSCTTDVGTPYATTQYQYDVAGNLRFVTDAESNQSETRYDTLGRKIFMHDPDMGDWTYAYDANGNLISQTDAKGQTIAFDYDALNRITKKDYPAGTDVVYTYDQTTSTYAIGKLTTVTDESGTSKFSYDSVGRTTKAVKTIDGTSYTIELIYDGLGRMTGIKYPDGEIVGYSYDTGGNISQVIGYATYTNYNALSQPGKITLGNGVSMTYQYYTTNNHLSSITTGSPAQAFLNLSYTYDNAGNITGISDNLDNSRTQSFIYDDLNRLFKAQSNSYGPLFYSYGQIGTILMKEGVSYTYGGSPHAVTATSDGNAYTYDSNGNMVSDNLRTITYNYDNKPTSVTVNGTTTNFAYNGDGARVKKITPQGTTLYIDKLYECKAGICSKYVFVGDTRIALKTSSTDILYYHQDHLASSRVVTDASGNKVEEMHYFPFGTTAADNGSISVSHKYTSQEFDAETGLYYYGARYYNPALARFMSPDSIVQNLADPQLLDPYSYGRNNPLIFKDPSGHFIEIIIASAIIGGYAAERHGGHFWQGALIGGISGAAGYGAGAWAFSAGGGQGFGALLGSGLVGGAAGGATGGGLNALLHGGNIMQGIAQGTLFGGISGTVAGGLTYLQIPNAIAAAGGGYASGYIWCGSKCAEQGAGYSFAGAVLQNALTIMGVGTDGKVPQLDTKEGKKFLRQVRKMNATAVTTPVAEGAGDDILWYLVALLGNGYSHTAHTKDTDYQPEGHYYKVVKTGVPYPKNAEAYLDTLGFRTLTTNNCTTRFGFTHPASYSSNYVYFGRGVYWWGW